MRLILASLSAARREMLSAAGVKYDAAPALVDEEAQKQSLSQDGLAARIVAKTLADMKARSLIEVGDALVIGCDQTLEFGDVGLLDKPRTEKDAIAQLKMLSGKSHFLHSAVSIAEKGKIVWRDVDTARLTMRPLSDQFIKDYVEQEFEAIRGCVGGYQIEGRGVQLFDWVEGNHFTILGMPLLPLLGYLRERKYLAS
jgi:septum formation protein